MNNKQKTKINQKKSQFYEAVFLSFDENDNEEQINLFVPKNVNVWSYCRDKMESQINKINKGLLINNRKLKQYSCLLLNDPKIEQYGFIILFPSDECPLYSNK